MAILPAFHTGTDDPDYGLNALTVYHDRTECHVGQLILHDRNQEFGKGGRPRCGECRKFGAI